MFLISSSLRFVYIPIYCHSCLWPSSTLGSLYSHQKWGVLARANSKRLTTSHEKIVECQGHKNKGFGKHADHCVHRCLQGLKDWPPTCACSARGDWVDWFWGGGGKR